MNIWPAIYQSRLADRDEAHSKINRIQYFSQEHTVAVTCPFFLSNCCLFIHWETRFFKITGSYKLCFWNHISKKEIFLSCQEAPKALRHRIAVFADDPGAEFQREGFWFRHHTWISMLTFSRDQDPGSVCSVDPVLVPLHKLCFAVSPCKYSTPPYVYVLK